MAAASPLTDAAPATADFEFAIGGMTCAACAAPVQAKLNKVDGVTATVNLATERAHVTAPARVSASDLVAVVEAAGYSAQPTVPASADAAFAEDGAAVRRLRRRLILALVFFVPLTDLSIVLSVFPWSRFPGWQWFLVVLAAPVAIWAAWPFHQAALRQARHFSSSMDTLVSLGILAACGWSVYAMFFLDRSRAGLGGLQALLHASGGGIYLEVAASVTTFLLAGRLYEARARRTAGEAMRDLAAGWCRVQEEAGCTAVLVSWDDAIRGALAVTDTVKPSAAPAVAQLRGLGLRPVLLTGDNPATAQAVAAAAGIDEVISEALPAAKARVITDLQAAGRSAAMVGDGVNDGPALAAAQLGLALGSGTDVAICAADMILLRDDLDVVPDAIRLARATFTTIRRNLAWAFCYNVLAIPLAALGFLNPIVAAATMTLSSVFVVWNSLRLRRFSASPASSGLISQSADTQPQPVAG